MQSAPNQNPSQAPSQSSSLTECPCDQCSDPHEHLAHPAFPPAVEKHPSQATTMAGTMPVQNLNVIALISGGKDSLYSMLHCMKHGHKIVALANLYPAPENENGEQVYDSDSYMYQTIGHSVIPLYEEALGIPLYRRKITGMPVNLELTYYGAQGSAADETEDLFELLKEVKEHHPEANAVSGGAIISNYQRSRIENIAMRLNLVPLAYLWMYYCLPPPTERDTIPAGWSPSVMGLLEDMADAGCEAVIVKVATVGLGVDSLLSNITSKDSSHRTNILTKLARYVSQGLETAILGEGGEYESLALDGPSVLWKKRIRIVKASRHDNGDYTAILQIKGAKCIEKPDPPPWKLAQLRVPQVFDATIHFALTVLVEKQYDYSMDEPRAPLSMSPALWGTPVVKPAILSSHNFLMVSNLCGYTGLTGTKPAPGVFAQIILIEKNLLNILHTEGEKRKIRLPVSCILSTTMLLRSKSDYQIAEEAYGRVFNIINPPTRVVIGCGHAMPKGIDVVLSFFADMAACMPKRALHITSLSYWAPASSYSVSQAVVSPLLTQPTYDQCDELVYLSGQLPIHPQYMTLFYGDFAYKTAISLQSAWRIGRAMAVDWWVSAVAFLQTGPKVRTQAKLAAHGWEVLNAARTYGMEEDPWPHEEYSTDTDDASITREVGVSVAAVPPNVPRKIDGREESEEEESELDPWDVKYGRSGGGKPETEAPRQLPNFSSVHSEFNIPPFLAVEVEHLPYDSPIQWQLIGVRSGRIFVTEEDSESTFVCKTESPSLGEYICIGIKTGEHAPGILSAGKVLDRYVTVDTEYHTTLYTTIPIKIQEWRGPIVPCISIWGLYDMEFAAAVTMHIPATPERRW
ncbi:hypothetical protein LOZ53_003977 [Ophidiomyces ophidiicola]|nr:hypothetical protein LOZ55_001577 [Ophidiomyces ophidiicola]KAI1988328.1 hypothetical protein LOZ53_003977 [Ophidiomyces ophidiicola]KAI1988548.1 hypothetical protein LOZ54_003152 [Ophidiomyces ophidiicola]KAI2003475.1 hypothetical protein LOZ51_000555 [Ophidiomyces ophidiicola]